MSTAADAPPRPRPLPAHWRRLKGESIGIMREAVAEIRSPVLLYSITPAEIVAELGGARHSERQGRLIDGDEDTAMRRKQREGCF